MVEIVQVRRFGAGQQSVKPANSSRRLVAALDFATSTHFRAIVFLNAVRAGIFPAGFFNIPRSIATRRICAGDQADVRKPAISSTSASRTGRYKKPSHLLATGPRPSMLLALGCAAQVRIWPPRVPSLIGAIGAVLLTIGPRSPL